VPDTEGYDIIQLRTALVSRTITAGVPGGPGIPEPSRSLATYHVECVRDQGQRVDVVAGYNFHQEKEPADPHHDLYAGRLGECHGERGSWRTAGPLLYRCCRLVLPPVKVVKVVTV
jgi:hypothetical protein